LLVFTKDDQRQIEQVVGRFGGVQKLPFTSEEDADMQELLSSAVFAVECENSLWKASQMPYYGSELRPMRRLGGELGLPKNAVLPTVIVKEEGAVPLHDWQEQRGVELHIWHVFYDMAFGIALDTVEELVGSGKIEPTVQVFQAPGGATTRKEIYKIYYHYAYLLGEAREEPSLVADQIIDANGHILPYVKFNGGQLELSSEALKVLNESAGGAQR
jgi:hypothetical protein